jgi:hypothetical protein
MPSAGGFPTLRLNEPLQPTFFLFETRTDFFPLYDAKLHPLSGDEHEKVSEPFLFVAGRFFMGGPGAG